MFVQTLKLLPSQACKSLSPKLGFRAAIAILLSCACLITQVQAADKPSAQTASQATSQAIIINEPTEESSARGKLLFSSNCMECHGHYGQGNGLLADVLDINAADLHQNATQKNRPDLISIISEGRGEMPAFKEKISQENIAHIANYLKTLESKLANSGGSIVVQRCAACHGLAGIAFFEGWPNLYEMSQTEIESKLKGHRAGNVPDSTMSRVTFDLSDEEIRQAAIYYSTRKPEH